MSRGNIILAVITVILLVQFMSCNKVDTIGEDIIGDPLNIKQTETGIKFFVEKVDSIITYKNMRSSVGNHYICGELDDPIFGYSKSDIYTQMRMNFRSGFDLSGDFKVDSAYTILYYDGSSFYGDTMAKVSISIDEMIEPLDVLNTYYSNEKFEVGQKIGGSTDFFVPDLNDSFEIYTNKAGKLVDTTLIRGAIKVPLNDNMFFNKILFDSLMFLNPDSLIEVINGLKISAQIENNSRLIGFNLPSSFLRVHYSSVLEDTNYVVNYYFGTISTDTLASSVNYVQNYSGSFISNYFNQDEDTIGFARGMSGVQTKVELEQNIDLGGNVAINHAELTLNVKELPGDNLGFYTPINILLSATKNSDDILSLTSDAQKSWESFFSHGNLDRLKSDYGGVVIKNSDSTWQYKMNITTYYQDFLNGLETGSFYISMPAGQESPSRVVICGPDDIQSPAKLKVTYTEF